MRRDNIFPKKKIEVIRYSEHPMPSARLGRADLATTDREYIGVSTNPRLMNPPFFLPQTNWRVTTILGVGEENTQTSKTPVLDHITGY